MDIQETDEKYMRQAINEAMMAMDADEVPIGAIVVSGNQIIGRGHNLTRTLNDPTAHAEMQAITAACNNFGSKYLTDCILYVTVEPCLMCAGAIRWAQLSRLVYGIEEPKFGYTVFSKKSLHPKTKVVSGVLAGECQSLMQDFFKKKRK